MLKSGFAIIASLILMASATFAEPYPDPLSKAYNQRWSALQAMTLAQVAAACDKGDFQACAEEADRYYFSRRGATQNDPHARQMGRKACEGGDPWGCWLQGLAIGSPRGQGWGPLIEEKLLAFETGCVLGLAVACNAGARTLQDRRYFNDTGYDVTAAMFADIGCTKAKYKNKDSCGVFFAAIDDLATYRKESSTILHPDLAELRTSARDAAKAHCTDSDKALETHPDACKVLLKFCALGVQGSCAPTLAWMSNRCRNGAVGFCELLTFPVKAGYIRGALSLDEIIRSYATACRGQNPMACLKAGGLTKDDAAKRDHYRIGCQIPVSGDSAHNAYVGNNCKKHAFFLVRDFNRDADFLDGKGRLDAAERAALLHCHHSDVDDDCLEEQLEDIREARNDGIACAQGKQLGTFSDPCATRRENAARNR